MSLLAILFISEIIEPVELTRKGIFVRICIFSLILTADTILLLIYFPADLIAFLLGAAIVILATLVIIYVNMKELEPLLETPKIEYALGIVIALVGGLVIFLVFPDNLIGILTTIVTTLLLYLFLFLAIHIYRTAD